jgi:hypothetical protein
MEVEMIEHLTAATFSFDKTCGLTEEQHKEVFIDIFVNLICFFRDQLKEQQDIVMCCKNDINLPDIINGKCSSISYDIFYANIRKLASAIYLSDNDEVVLKFDKYDLELLAVMDPIYFSFSRTAAIE